LPEVNSRAKGTRGEELSVSYLKENGFEILDRNYYAKKFGEIDIIALKDEVLHFVEVKSSNRDFDPVYNLTPQKLKRVIRSAQYYMRIKGLNNPFSIDAVVIRGSDIEFIENITL